MAQDTSMQSARSKRRWDTSANMSFGGPGDAQRRSQRPIPSYAAHTISSVSKVKAPCVDDRICRDGVCVKASQVPSQRSIVSNLPSTSTVRKPIRPINWEQSLREYNPQIPQQKASRTGAIPKTVTTRRPALNMSVSKTGRRRPLGVIQETSKAQEPYVPPRRHWVRAPASRAVCPQVIARSPFEIQNQLGSEERFVTATDLDENQDGVDIVDVAWRTWMRESLPDAFNKQRKRGNILPNMVQQRAQPCPMGFQRGQRVPAARVGKQWNVQKVLSPSKFATDQQEAAVGIQEEEDPGSVIVMDPAWREHLNRGFIMSPDTTEQTRRKWNVPQRQDFQFAEMFGPQDEKENLANNIDEEKGNVIVHDPCWRENLNRSPCLFTEAKEPAKFQRQEQEVAPVPTDETEAGAVNVIDPNWRQHLNRLPCTPVEAKEPARKKWGVPPNRNIQVPEIQIAPQEEVAPVDTTAETENTVITFDPGWRESIRAPLVIPKERKRWDLNVKTPPCIPCSSPKAQEHDLGVIDENEYAVIVHDPAWRESIQVPLVIPTEEPNEGGVIVFDKDRRNQQGRPHRKKWGITPAMVQQGLVQPPNVVYPGSEERFVTARDMDENQDGVDILDAAWRTWVRESLPNMVQQGAQPCPGFQRGQGVIEEENHGAVIVMGPRPTHDEMNLSQLFADCIKGNAPSPSTPKPSFVMKEPTHETPPPVINIQEAPEELMVLTTEKLDRTFTCPQGPQARFRGFVNIKQDIPPPRRSSTPQGAAGYMPSQDVPELPGADNLDGQEGANFNASGSFLRNAGLENSQQAAYLGNRSPSENSQRYMANQNQQYRSPSGGGFQANASPTRYQQRVMFEPNLPTSARNQNVYESNYGADYDQKSQMIDQGNYDQIMDPIQRSIINEAEEMIDQYEEEAVPENPDVQSYAVTPMESQSSISSAEPSEAQSNLTTLERDIAKREKEERRQLHKDLKKWQKQRRKLLLSQPNEFPQEAENYDPSNAY